MKKISARNFSKRIWKIGRWFALGAALIGISMVFVLSLYRSDGLYAAPQVERAVATGLKAIFSRETGVPTEMEFKPDLTVSGFQTTLELGQWDWNNPASEIFIRHNSDPVGSVTFMLVNNEHSLGLIFHRQDKSVLGGAVIELVGLELQRGERQRPNLEEVLKKLLLYERVVRRDRVIAGLSADEFASRITIPSQAETVLSSVWLWVLYVLCLSGMAAGAHFLGKGVKEIPQLLKARPAKKESKTFESVPAKQEPLTQLSKPDPVSTKKKRKKGGRVIMPEDRPLKVIQKPAEISEDTVSITYEVEVNERPVDPVIAVDVLDGPVKVDSDIGMMSDSVADLPQDFDPAGLLVFGPASDFVLMPPPMAEIPDEVTDQVAVAISDYPTLDFEAVSAPVESSAPETNDLVRNNELEIPFTPETETVDHRPEPRKERKEKKHQGKAQAGGKHEQRIRDFEDQVAKLLKNVSMDRPLENRLAEARREDQSKQERYKLYENLIFHLKNR